jgi:hypothetical protein
VRLLAAQPHARRDHPYRVAWKQPLSASEVGPAKGRVTAYVNDERYTGAPGSIPLKAHERI